jgi:hypothetical protein
MAMREVLKIAFSWVFKIVKTETKNNWATTYTQVNKL